MENLISKISNSLNSSDLKAKVKGASMIPDAFVAYHDQALTKAGSWMNALLSNLKKLKSSEDLIVSMDAIILLIKVLPQTLEGNKIMGNILSNLTNTLLIINKQFGTLKYMTLLFQNVPKGMRPFRSAINKTLAQEYTNCIKSDLSVKGVVDLEIEIELSMIHDASVTLSKAGIFQGSLDSICFIVNALWVCLEGFRNNLTCEHLVWLIRDSMDEDYMIQLPKFLKLLDFFCFSMIPAICRNSRYAQVTIDIRKILDVALQIFDFSIVTMRPHPQRDPEEYKALVASIPRLYLAINNALRFIVIRLNRNLSLHCLDIFQICLKGLEKGSLETKKSSYDLLSLCLEHIPSFFEMDFSLIFNMLQNDWTISEQSIAFNEEKTSNPKKRKIRIEKVKSPYELMLPQLSVRSHIINVFYNMLHYNATFHSLDGFSASILEDLLVMRINHVNTLYEEYHIKLIKVVSELLLSNYPKHIFPLALFCFQRGFYSDHASIKSASIYGLKICEAIVHCQRNAPEPFLLPFTNYQPEKATSTIATLIGQIDSNNDILNDHGVADTTVKYSREKLEKEVANLSQPPSLPKGSFFGANVNKEAIEAEDSVASQQAENAQDDIEEDQSSYIELEIEDITPKKEVEENDAPTEIVKEDLIHENLHSDETLEIQENEKVHFKIDVGNESEGNDGSIAFSIPEINIDSSDDEA